MDTITRMPTELHTILFKMQEDARRQEEEDLKRVTEELRWMVDEMVCADIETRRLVAMEEGRLLEMSNDLRSFVRYLAQK